MGQSQAKHEELMRKVNERCKAFFQRTGEQPSLVFLGINEGNSLLGVAGSSLKEIHGSVLNMGEFRLTVFVMHSARSHIDVVKV